jgi:diacylglycerol kinase family enzyme
MALVAFVVNRTLLRDPRGFLRRCQAAARDRGWEPWFAPTGRDAVAARADLVFAAGGDGTVRGCAEALAGTGMPLAIVPLGTANLAARALGVPGQAGRALDAGFGGRDRTIDLGRIEEEGVVLGGGRGTGGGVGKGGTWFAAMAGIGLDAAVVGAAPEPVKQRLGWVAYALAGATRLWLPPRDFTVQVDGAEPVRRRARCVVVANAGLLPGGFTLLPTARIDDGQLDIGVLAPTGWGWVRVAGRVLTRGEDRQLECFPARRVRISADTELPRQVDGEIAAPGRTLQVSVSPGALVVRQPR